jgi:hypothetical protein
MEVGAPANGIVLALGANALTPRRKDLDAWGLGVSRSHVHFTLIRVVREVDAFGLGEVLPELVPVCKSQRR